ncbi:hypothetical protein Tco_0957277, partial [Tanacetum coccineum]
NLYTSAHFELFLHTHTKGHDKQTFINEMSKTINENMLRLRQDKGIKSESTKAQKLRLMNEQVVQKEGTSMVLSQKELITIGMPEIEQLQPPS